ncbi:hypothetical protein C1I63_13290 [Rathayibacter caricis DSM 15933]|uniref:M23ase beta-sheet core domain-containing protein n=1 Tax=Rathayibacter caricis DSM 15933 TaxID=1328867 RepID=A0A2T4UW10_9MICO|nr:hypothetical protein C1I63_13290 [Rathayibacter caricis DSM 15933]
MTTSMLLRPGVFLALLSGLLGSSEAVPPGSLWVSPVPGFVVVEPWQAPEHRYAAGHRGIDLEATAGAPVVAATGGTVSFAGRVVDRGVVSIEHADGLVSSVEPVEATVSAGAFVAPGDVIGTVGGGGHCDARCVHLGVREDGEYVSPMRFFGGIPRAVLLPLDVASGARVSEPVGVADALGRDVRVDLGRPQARVAEHLLDRAEVGSPVEQVGGGGVAERVRTGGAGAVLEEARDDSVDRAGREARAPPAEQERVLRLGLREVRAGRVEVGDERLLRRDAEGDDALLRALAGDEDGEP